MHALLAIAIACRPASAPTPPVSSGNPSPRAHGAAGAIDHEVIVVGGTHERALLAIVDIFDTRANSWRRGAPLPTPRDFPAAAVLAGKLHVIGGLFERDPNAIATVEAYDVARDRWESRAPLAIARSRAAAATFGDRIFVFGGIPKGDVTAEQSAPVEMLDPVTNRWTVVAEMPGALHGHTATRFGDAILIVGGYARGPTANVWWFDPRSHRFTPAAPLASARGFHGTAVISRELVVFGGRGPVPHPTEIFDGTAWRTSDPIARSRFASATIGERVYIIGGEAPAGGPVAELVLVRDRWP